MVCLSKLLGVKLQWL